MSVEKANCESKNQNGLIKSYNWLATALILKNLNTLHLKAQICLLGGKGRKAKEKLRPFWVTIWLTDHKSLRHTAKGWQGVTNTTPPALLLKEVHCLNSRCGHSYTGWSALNLKLNGSRFYLKETPYSYFMKTYM